MLVYKELTVLKYDNYYFYIGSRETYKNKSFAPNELLVSSGTHLESYRALIDANINPILGDYTRVAMRAIYFMELGLEGTDRTIWNDYFMNSFGVELVVSISQTKEIYRIPFDYELYDMIQKRFANRKLRQLTHESIPKAELKIRNELYQMGKDLYKNRRDEKCLK